MDMVAGTRPARGVDRLAPIIGLVVALAGVTVLVGWAFDLPVLKGVAPGLATMKANTALGFILCGACLWLSAPSSATGTLHWKGRLSAGCALVLGALGLLSLAEHGFGWDLGIDQLLVRDVPATPAEGAPGRMSNLAALNFMLLAAAFLLVNVQTRTGRRPSHWLALLVCADAYLAILGYVYGVSALYAVVAMSAVALHTAVLFVLAGIGVVCARPGSPFGGHVLGDNLASEVNRRLLPVAMLVPPLLGWLSLRGELLGLYPARFGLAIFTMGNVAIVSLLVWRSAHTLQQMHQERIVAVHVSAWQRAILNSADLTVIATDVDGAIRSVNAEAERKLGYASWELLGKSPLLLHVASEVAARATALSEELGCEVPASFEVFAAKARRGMADEHDWTYRRKDGSSFPVRLCITPLRDENGTLTGFLGVGTDITQRQRAEAELLYLAHFDGLTGLANRRHFLEILGESIARSERDGSALALIFLDLDRFKQINDSFGHHVGDLVLKEFARRLSDSVRTTDTVARLAGDEFVIILSLFQHPEDAPAVAEKIALSMQEPFLILGHRHTVSAAMGIALRRPGETDAEAWLRRADAVLYRNKRSGHQAYCIEA